MIEQDKEQIYKYLILEKDQESKISDSLYSANERNECIKIAINKEKEERQPVNTNLFVDPQFAITKGEITKLQEQFGEQIIAKRLCRLFPQKHQPQLFPHPPKKAKISKDLQAPHFVFELSMFQPESFKRVIINNKVSQNGQYQLLINRSGRYQLMIIDDIIPVLAHSQEPLWGQYLNEPWKLILAKAWAKVNKGYSNLKTANSFQFLEIFLEINWKYFNLTTHGRYFLNFYKDKISQQSRILLKSKRNEKVKAAGLVSGKICYQLLAIETGKDDNLILLIRTGFQNFWTGKQSIFDKQVMITDKVIEKFQLKHTIMLNTKDFFNIFSNAYVTHARIPLPIFRSFLSFENASNQKQAKYFQVRFSREGFFNFSISQPQENLVSIGNNQEKSLLDSRLDHTGKRYLAIKYLLSRKIDKDSQFLIEESKEQSRIVSLIHESRRKFDQKYYEIDYDLHEIDHKSGFKKGAHFVRVIPGIYILRVKAETSSAISNFTISYTTHEITEIKAIEMSKQQSMDFLSHNIISFSDRFPNQSSFKQKYEHFSLEDLTDTFGYAFAAIKVNKKCPYLVIVEVNPETLTQEGYALKSPFKKKKGKFQIQVNAGQCKAIVFKRIKDKKSYSWPSKAFTIFIDKQ